MYFLRGSLNPSPSSLGATLKGKNLLHWGANSLLQEYPPPPPKKKKFEVIQLAPLKY